MVNSYCKSLIHGIQLNITTSIVIEVVSDFSRTGGADTIPTATIAVVLGPLAPGPTPHPSLAWLHGTVSGTSPVPVVTHLVALPLNHSGNGHA